MSAIALEGVTKDWGATRAVDAVSFDVEEGTLAVLLGPSGCGKSTTLRLVAGLEAVSSGRVFIGGADVTAEPPGKRNVSMVFQSYALFPHLSVAENILFGLKVRKVPAEERDRRLARVAELLGLTALVARKPSQLSGGQQQRVALGRAIIAETPVCLMDEPLSNLDAKLRHDMRREIRALQQKLGITMLYVTHDQVEAMSMADRVVLLRDGRIEQNAAPAELYARPATAFAASFIGTPPMNIIPLADAPGGAVIAGTGGPALAAARGATLLAGVRPEALRLATDAGVAALVEESEYLGADTMLVCRAGDARLVARLPGRVTIAPGAPVRLAWQPQDLHFFDAGTRLRRDDVAAVPLPC
ncbi:MAG: ABC transporter ATP-binding protein [Burkholderiales bacterium]|nr:ABC transporter ATP-binding protein [Burkholderiales bacterium]